MSSRPAPDAGFSLLEMLVVLAIVALVATSIPFISHGGGTELRGLGSEVATALRGLRETAIRSQQEAEFTLAPQSGGYRLGDRLVALPPGVTLGVSVAEPPLLGDLADHVVFYPDGSSTGGTITLSRGGVSVTITIGWMDGRIATDG